MNAWPILADLSEKDRSSLLVWLGVLLGVVVVGFGAILLLRRYLRDPSTSGTGNVGFSLSELRLMRDRGEITSEEYERTRAMVIAKVKAASARAEERKGGAPENGVPPA
jgi:hypothetical protein